MRFFAREAERLRFSLPEPGSYGVGMVFFPRNDEQRERCRKVMNRVIREEGFEVLGWRDTPIDANAIGQVARASRPYIEQVFIAAAASLGAREPRRTPATPPHRLPRRAAGAEKTRWSANSTSFASGPKRKSRPSMPP